MTGVGRLTHMRALAIAIVLAVAAAPAYADVLKVGDRAVELVNAKDASDKPFKLGQLKDQWVVVTVGAKWCKPCAKELPTWDKLAGVLNGKVKFVALDIDEDPADGKAFHKKLKLRNLVLVYVSPDSSVSRYGSDTMPTTMVIDPKGVIRHVKKGFDEKDKDGEFGKLKETLDKLMKG
jgi:thiol-disulfide isomerase/thioredoxin